eukprot:518696-Prymnesium_polylepis.1
MADDKPYGTALAEAVAEHLKSGHYYVYEHRDYCGVGLQYEEARSRFSMGMAMDGCMAAETTWAATDNRSATDEFVCWLAEQSDSTLHGDGNQRLTRARLLASLPGDVVAKLVAADPAVAGWAARKAEKDAAEKLAAERAAKEKAEREAAAALAAKEKKEADAAAKVARQDQERQTDLATDDTKLEGMSKQEVVALVKRVAPPDSALVQSNIRVIMSPMSTKEQVVALWKQVQAAAT